MVTLGIDIGSASSKCALLEDGRFVLGGECVDAGIGTDGAERALSALFGRLGVSPGDVAYTVATGYGRRLWKRADSEISELTAHALGCAFLLPGTRTVIDIGGQDAKAISLDERGGMKSFVMNDKCTAGTGRFLEVMARILGISVSELGQAALLAAEPASISSTCTVFAESEVISRLSEGVGREDMAAGICRSAASRAAALCRRVGVKEKVCVSGGVALSDGVREALSQALGVPVERPETPQLAGAIGAALHAYGKVCDKHDRG